MTSILFTYGSSGTLVSTHLSFLAAVDGTRADLKITGAMLRLVHVAVDLHRMPGVTGEHLENSFDPCLGRISDNLAGARLDPDLLQHGIRAERKRWT